MATQTEVPLTIVHTGTTVTVNFGVLDEDGNVIAQEPVTLQIHKLSPEAFQEAYELVLATRNVATPDAGGELPEGDGEG